MNFKRLSYFFGFKIYKLKFFKRFSNSVLKILALKLLKVEFHNFASHDLFIPKFPKITTSKFSQNLYLFFLQKSLTFTSKIIIKKLEMKILKQTSEKLTGQIQIFNDKILNIFFCCDVFRKQSMHIKKLV